MISLNLSSKCSWFPHPGQNLKNDSPISLSKKTIDATSSNDKHCCHLFTLFCQLRSIHWTWKHRMDSWQNPLSFEISLHSEEALLQPVHHGPVLLRPRGQKFLLQTVQLLGHVVLNEYGTRSSMTSFWMEHDFDFVQFTLQNTSPRKRLVHGCENLCLALPCCCLAKYAYLFRGLSVNGISEISS